MRRIAIAVLTVMLLSWAAAEDISGIVDSIDIGDLQQAADKLETGIDVRGTIMEIASGETKLDGRFLKETWTGLSGAVFGHMRDVLISFMGPMFVSALYMRMFPQNRRAGGLICACACTAVFMDVMSAAAETTRRLTGGIAEVIEALLPLITGLTAMAGATASASLITPMATLAGEIILNIIGDIGTALACAAGACACACAIGSELKIDGIFVLLKKLIQTGAGLAVAIFAGILKVQGMLGASFDSVAVKTTRFAVDKIVPVVGGGISDTMDAAISSIILINSAAGVTGMILIISLCALPIIRLAAVLVALRVARAIAQPVADGGIMDAADRFGDVIRLMVVLCVTAVTISLVLIGAAIGAGKSI